ncbi:MAG: aspartate aminotransferase family protein [Halobacteriaceae archaeon]
MDRETARPDVDVMPGKRAKEWADHHAQTAAKTTYVYDFVWDVTEPAIGPFCTDVDGNVLLDFTSHVASAPLGYNNPTLRDRLGAFDLPDPGKIAGQDFYASGGWPPEDPEFPGPTQLMDRIRDRTSHYDLDTVFLSNSGAEAVENAIKICYQDRPSAGKGLTFEGAFHGRTLGALSLNRSKAPHRRHFPEIPGIESVPFCDDEGCTAATCSCGFFPTETDSVLRRKLRPGQGSLDPETLAYVILEPIQGEGGYRFPSDAFMDELAALTEEHDIPVIADEIQAGLGRTGEFWGSDNYPIEPDVITAAKGLRVGATVANRDRFPVDKARLSSTWGAGDIVAALQGCLTLDVIEDEGLLDNAVRRGRQLRDLLTDLEAPFVENVRGKGLMVAFDLDTKDRREAVIKASLNRGLLLLGCGHRTIRVLPPLDVREREIEIGVDVLGDALDDSAVVGAGPSADAAKSP